MRSAGIGPEIEKRCSKEGALADNNYDVGIVSTRTVWPI